MRIALFLSTLFTMNLASAAVQTYEVKNVCGTYKLVTGPARFGSPARVPTFVVQNKAGELPPKHYYTLKSPGALRIDKSYCVTGQVTERSFTPSGDADVLVELELQIRDSKEL